MSVEREWVWTCDGCGATERRADYGLPPGHDWEPIARDFLERWHLPVFPGYTALQSLRTQLDPAAGAWAGKESRPNARVAWWRIVDQTVGQS